MVIDNLLGVIHAAVANFNSVTIEDICEACDLWESVYLLSEESVSDVSADILAEGRVIPENIVALSVFSFVRCFGFIL